MKHKNNEIFNQLENFQLHHKILLFSGIIILTILAVRFSVNIYNPNPTIFNFELHHFDYGILLLMVSTLLLLFRTKRYYLYLLLSAISFGLVIDDLWFIRKNIIDPNINEATIYNQTLPIVVIFVIVLILATILINHFNKR